MECLAAVHDGDAWTKWLLPNGEMARRPASPKEGLGLGSIFPFFFFSLFFSFLFLFFRFFYFAYNNRKICNGTTQKKHNITWIPA